MNDETQARAKKRILVVDDHPLLRQGIGQLINDQPDDAACGEAEDRTGAMTAAEAGKPDLAVVDITLKDQSGFELIKDFKARFPGMAVLVLSMHEESLYAERALRAGARGYIMKREASDKVLEGIRAILAGRVFVSDRIAAGILDKVSGHPPSSPRSPMSVLSDREVEVLLLIGKGHGSPQIGRELHISVKTVEAHRANIKLKLGLQSSSELLQFAIGWAGQIGEI